MTSSARLLALTFVVSACGSTETGSVADDGGAVAPPPQGGLAMMIGSAPAPPPGRKCTVLPHDVSVGSPPPSGVSPGERVKDDNGGASIACSVVAAGSGFDFSGSISVDAVAFTIQGNLPAGGTGAATVSEFDVASVVTLQNPTDTPCQVVVDPPLEVAAGRIWAAFDCPAFVDQSQPDGPLYCQAEQGYFVLENCKED